MTHRLFAVIVLGLASVASQPACAFNDLGHSVIAKVAYDQLSVDQRQAIHEVLKQHPHYRAYLTTGKPRRVRLEEWVFLRAATWCDWVRGQDRDFFHRGPWHYVNIPFRRGQAVGPLPPALPQRRNLQERLPKAMKMVAGGAATNSLGLPKSLTKSERHALAVTWLFHLLGDVHQPLHVAALIAEPGWPTSEQGDQGGNRLAVVVRGTKPVKLHSYWDGALDLPMDYTQVEAVVRSFTADPPLSADRLRTLGSVTDVDAWINESYRIAVEYCYLDGQLPLAPWLDAYELHDAVARPEVPVLGEAVQRNARRVTRQRLLLAGTRLAHVLRDAFPSGKPPDRGDR